MLSAWLLLLSAASPPAGTSVPTLGPTPQSVAVLPIAAKGKADKALLLVLDDLLLSSLQSSAGGMRVIGRSDIDAMLGFEKTKDAAGCSDVACATELAGALGVDSVIAPTAGTLGTKYILTLVWIDQRRAQVLQRHSEELGRDPEAFRPAIDTAVARLLAPANRSAAARQFVADVDRDLRTRWTEQELASWNHATNITPETERAQSAAAERVMEYLSRAIKEAAGFDGAALDSDTRRRLDLLKRATTLPAPSEPAKRAELARVHTELFSAYGTGKFCEPRRGGAPVCRDLEALSDVLAESRDEAAQLAAWTGWHSVSPPMRAGYARLVALANEGAKEIGYADAGQLWRSGFDMPPDAFAAEMERLWSQVRPLYESLHCLTRRKLAEKYPGRVNEGGRIPAHLLGNMWAQDWSHLYPWLEPHVGQPSIDVTRALEAKGYDAIQMVKRGEAFFVSLGLDPLPQTFWQRSMFTKPKDREVVCHASAWDIGFNDDLRIKMCIKPTMEDFITIHHELGHNYYYHYYFTLPILYQAGAHDGFHEALGDTLALSVTPTYLHRLGLLEQASDDARAVLNKQMQVGLDKIAFLPFGLLVDRWRWKVFAGEIPESRYNAAWWEMRQQYQGVQAPMPRSERDFDPGAKYHIPANVPYARYFLATILQFQFHAALCQAAGHKGPLHTCSIFGSKAAGDRLRAMMQLGASRPWPEALEALTGTRTMDAGPLLAYFAPLRAYLDTQNAGRRCGW